MNKKAICVVSLLLYLLIASTLFSGKIQEEMTILVKGAPRTSSKETGREMTIDWRAIYTEYNEETQTYEDHLYEVRESTGWNQGLRFYNIEDFGIDPLKGIASATLNRDVVLVQAASRQPQEGKLAKVVEEFETGDDIYLYHYPNGVPEEWEFPRNLEVIGESEHYFLTDVTDATFPFLPLTAKTWNATTDRAKRVFSLTEAEEFLQQLPNAMLSFMIVAIGVLFCICGCFAGFGKRKGLVWLNAAAACISLVALIIVFQNFDLPGSMLPSNSIFDFAYYQEEFALIFDSLRELGMTDHTLFQTASQVKVQCAQMLWLSGITAVCVIVLEIFVAICTYKKRSHRVINNG